VTRLPPWYVIEGYVQGCWRHHEGEFGTPFPQAGDLSRWHQLYRDAGGALPGEDQPPAAAERDARPGPWLAPPPFRRPPVPSPPGAAGLGGENPGRSRSRWSWIGRRRIDPVFIGAVLAAAMLLVAAATLGIITLVSPRPAPASPWTRQAVKPLPNGLRQPLAAVTIPAATLQPRLAQWLSARITAGRDVTGYELRSAYPAATPLCLAAVAVGPDAGQKGGGVDATACTPSARSQIWIPAQYEDSGSRYTWLVNDQYQDMCLNADNRGGGVHQGSRVQLWDCYLPKRGDYTRFAESWDFSTWLHARQSGATSYPLFVGVGNYSLDADRKSLQGGLPAVSLSVINHYRVPWEYWY